LPTYLAPPVARRLALHDALPIWPLLPLRWMVLPTTVPRPGTVAEPEYWRSECGAYAMPSQVPLLPEIFSPLLLVVTLAKNSICCEYGAKFMLGEEMLIEPVATKVTLDVTVVLRPLEKLMLPFT